MTTCVSLGRQYLEFPILDKFEGEDCGPFLHQAVAVGRHGAWCDAAHICVMPPGRYKEHNLPLVKHRSDDCDVWKMRSPGQLRVIGHQDVPFIEGLLSTAIFAVVPYLQSTGSL